MIGKPTGNPIGKETGKHLLRSVIATAVALGAAPLLAQQLEEVTVTAQKRTQSVQDIPISVSALGSEDIRADLIETIFDLRTSVPALDVRAVDPPSQGTSFAIRGLGTSVFNMGFEATVATFIDGVYRSRSGLVSGADLVDLERIEVLKGPQGTLFGKNSTGGVVAMYTRKPELDDTSGMVELSYDEYSVGRLNAMFNYGSDTVAARITASVAQGDGWMENVTGGEEIHDRDRYNLRGQLLFAPNDDFTLRIIADYAELEEKCCTAMRYENDPRSFATNQPLAEAVGSTIIDPADVEDLKVSLNADPTLDAEDKGLSAEINWDVGSVRLTSITAWREYSDEGTKDNDFVGVDVLHSNQDLPEVSLFSQELRLAGTADLAAGLDWTVGVYYADEKTELLNEFIWGQQGVIHSNVLAYSAEFEQEAETLAIFAHGIFNLTEQLSLTLGLRYTDDEKEGSLVNTHPLAPVPFPPFEIPSVFPLPVVHDYDDEVEDDETTGTASLQYNFNDDVMGYVSYSTGYKSGGISMTRDAAGPLLGFSPMGPTGPFPAVDPTFEKETADSIEAGVKTELMDQRLRLNFAAWYTEFDDLQVQVLNPEGNFAVTNVDGAESTGVEADMVFAISDSWRLNAAIQWLDATYADDVGGLTTPVPVGGEDLSHAPEWSGNVGLRWDGSITGKLDGFASANLYYKDDHLVDPDPALNREQESYYLLSARAGIRTADERWELSAWCRNCADESYVTSKFQIPFDGALFFPHDTKWSHVGAPRTVGVTGRFNF
jgi:outer membrane receptor protein involved in Fe transport